MLKPYELLLDEEPLDSYDVTFEGLKINGKEIYDDMPGKPKWYQTADYVPMFVDSHVENLKFSKWRMKSEEWRICYCYEEIPAEFIIYYLFIII